MMLAWALFLCFAVSRPTSASVRIVGGSKAAIEDYPYQLSLQYGGKHFCGGVILTEKFSLSAAHCFKYFRDSISVRAGSSLSDQGGILVDVEKIINHPRYGKNRRYDYDMAVLILAKPLEYSDKIKPLMLPDTSVTEPPAGALGVVTGWGFLDSERTQVTNELMEVELPVWSWAECRKKYSRGSGQVTERMFCAGFPEGGKDACSGDSGGAFAINKTLYGIISHGPGCASKGRPGMYTSVPALRDFIKKQTGL